MKRFAHIVIIVLFILLFSGCGSFSIGSQTNIDKNGSGNISLKVTYDGIFKQAIGENKSILKENGFFSIPNAQVIQSVEGDKIIEDAVIPFKSIDELNNLFTSNDSNKDTFTANVKVDKGLIKNTYTYELKLPKSFSLKTLTDQMNANTPPGEIELFTFEDVSNFLGSAITFSNSATLPGKVISSNATKIEGNKLTWGYTLSQIDPSKPLTASYEMVNTFNIIMTTIGILIVILLIAFLFIRKRRKIKGFKDSTQFEELIKDTDTNNEPVDENKSDEDYRDKNDSE